VQRLIHDGLATHVPNRGAEVTVLRIAELREIYQVKEPLATLASRLAAPRLSQEDAATLLQMVERQEQTLALEASPATMMSLDIEFHRFIALRSGNATLVAALDQFTDRTNLAFPSAWGNPEYARYSVDEHRAIAENLHRGDAEGAERATRSHVRNIVVRLERHHRSQRQAPSGTRP
jgi:DNA-binding GntR family transcriptional regulator